MTQFYAAIAASSCDEFERVCLLRCVVDFLIRGVQTTVKDVLLQRVVEKKWLLLHQAEPLAKLRDVQRPHIDAIDEDLAEIGIVEAHHEADEGGFALA